MANQKKNKTIPQRVGEFLAYLIIGSITLIVLTLVYRLIKIILGV